MFGNTAGQEQNEVGMLLPLFDKDCDLVAWIDPGKSIFDLDMNWVAYIANNNLWSAKTNEWIGPISGLLCFDAKGKPVLWNPKENVRAILPPLRPLNPLRPLTPLKPLKPLKPLRPLRPLTPLGGWSVLSYYSWIMR